MTCERIVFDGACGLPAYWVSDDIALCEECCVAVLLASDPTCARYETLGEAGETERVAT